MACKVNWPRFYLRHRMMIRKLATGCGCKACKKQIKVMDETDNVLKVNDENRSQRLYAKPNLCEKI